MAERNLNFDTIIDRRRTNSLKYDFAEKNGMPEDILPLWVADMDFGYLHIFRMLLLSRRNMGFMDTVSPADLILKRSVHG